MTDETGRQTADAGSVLRKRRMLRGQSLEAVHAGTRIPKGMLEALEENRFDAFPAPVYLRGFLKNYCDFLELDFDPLWRQLQPSADEKKEDGERSGGLRTPKKEPAALFWLPLTESNFMPVLIFVALVVAGAMLWALKGEPPPAAAPAHAPAAAVRAVRPAGGASLVLTAARAGWVRVRADGHLRFEGRLPAGARQSWEAKGSFRVTAPDPGAFRAELDGKEVELGHMPVEPDGTRVLGRR